MLPLSGRPGTKTWLASPPSSFLSIYRYHFNLNNSDPVTQVLFMGACMKPPHLAIVTSLCKVRFTSLYLIINVSEEKLSPPCARWEIHLYDCRPMIIDHYWLLGDDHRKDPTDYFELLSDLKKNCIYLFGQGNTLYTHLHLRRDKFYMNKVAEKAQQ